MTKACSSASKTLVACCILGTCAWAQSTATFPAPGQPLRTGTPGTFEIVGDSLVSAQQIFLGTPNRVYVVDKVEGNPTQINGHPAWASEYDINSDNVRAMDIVTNSFCAGGNVLGNGTWLNVGGNQAVTYGGLDAASQTGGPPYENLDGGLSIRLLTPCDDGNCEWIEGPPMTTRRWYATLETLEDGSIFIMGGNRMGGFVNDAGNNNPTYEYFPSRGEPVESALLQNTLPANLYPFVFLLPSGNLFVQLDVASAIIDNSDGSNTEHRIDDIPDAVRTYPASAAVAMMPMTPANNWTATVLFCGGTNIRGDSWNQTWNIAQFPSSSSCVSISPDFEGSYHQEEPLPEGRVMANFIALPDGRYLCLNGANLGSAGYGNTTWAIGQSFGDSPLHSPILYDPSAPAGQRWTRDGLSDSTIDRMYHSSAVLLPDGSVFVSGSNPNADYTVGPDVRYPTEYRTERFYPPYYSERRPQPQNLPTSIGYGGAYFDVKLDSDDLSGNAGNAANAKVVLIRTGFSTHAFNFGQRYVELNSTYTANDADNSAVLHVSQLPPNPYILAPGPALLFVVVNGVPSVGVQVMVGSGEIGVQPVEDAVVLPVTVASSRPASSGNGSGGDNSSDNGASALVSQGLSLLFAAVLSVLCMFLLH